MDALEIARYILIAEVGDKSDVLLHSQGVLNLLWLIYDGFFIVILPCMVL
jgi:hypothetical protein